MKLKLKEWMKAVSSWIKKHETASYASSTGTYTDFSFYRKGNVVMMSSWGSVPAAADGAVFANIPAGYRPINNCDFPVWNTAGTRLGTIRIQTNGTITPVFGSLTAGNVRQTFTYVGGGTA